MDAPSQSSVAGRPVVALTLALNYAMSGLHTWSYHATNLALHISAALLLFGIVRRTSGRPGVSLAIALIWLVHPLQTESVTYIVQRTELLAGFFILLTLYCVIRGWNAPAVVACALAMGSKEVAAVTPVLMLLYDRIFLPGPVRQRWRLYAGLTATWFVLGASLAMGARAETVGLGHAEIPPLDYLRTQCGVIVHYIRLAVWPRPLVLDYSDWPVARSWAAVWLPAVVVAGLLAGTLWMRRKPAGFIGAWFFLILAPSSSVVPIVTEIAAERRMYLPMAAVIALVVLVGARLPRRTGATLLAVTVLGLGLLTMQRNNDYRSEETIWRDTVAKRPGDVRATVNLGTVVVRQGRVEEAVALYRRALEVNPESSEAHFNLGVTLVGQGRFEEAIPHLQRAVELAPQSAMAHYNLGVVLARAGQTDEAIAQLRGAARLNPRDAHARNDLGAVLATQGRLEEAMLELAEAARLDPQFADARRNLARARRQLEQTNDAQQGRAP